MNPDNKKTKVPYSISKTNLVKLCRPLAEDTVIRRINLIIFETRKNYPENIGRNLQQIIRAKYVEQSEIKEYFETYGLPDHMEW